MTCIRNLLRIAFAVARGDFGSFVQAQNIGINANGATPDPSTMLNIDVSALDGTKRGLLIPRLTTVERLLISSPATGLLVYDSDDNNFWYYDGTARTELLNGGNLGWALTGNTGSEAGTNFIVTTANIPLEVRVYNQRAGYLGNTATDDNTS